MSIHNRFGGHGADRPEKKVRCSQCKVILTPLTMAFMYGDSQKGVPGPICCTCREKFLKDKEESTDARNK